MLAALIARMCNSHCKTYNACLRACVRGAIAQLVREPSYGVFTSGTLKGRKFKSQ